MVQSDDYIDVTLDPVDKDLPYPDELAAAERRDGKDARIGVALSGGGIRSATLSLGFFQGLATKSLLKYVDILSTVSGGGYFGGFYGHLVQREALEKHKKDPTKPITRDIADEVLKDPQARWVKFLRENGRYLAPNGAGDLLTAAAVAIRNWFAVIIVLGTFALMGFSLITLVRFAIEQQVATLGVSVAWPAVWLSPWFLAVAIAFPVLAVPPGWSYWLVRDSAPFNGPLPWLARWAPPVAIVGLTVYALGARWSDWDSWTAAEWSLVALAITTLLTIGRFFVGRLLEANDPAVQRQHLSRGFARALTSIGILLLIAIFDSVGLAIVHYWNAGLLGVSGGIAAAIGFLRNPLTNFVTGLGRGERPRIPVQLLALVASAVLVLVALGGVASIPYFAAYGGLPLPIEHPALLGPGSFTHLYWLSGLSMLLALVTGLLRPFVNRSSLHAMYESRLRRAYLGASNPERIGKDKPDEDDAERRPQRTSSGATKDDLEDEVESRPAVTESREKDSIAWPAYDPSRYGGPLHLINVTVNETVYGRSQVEQRDRKGLGMAVGPAAVSVGRTHHALWNYETLPPLKLRIARDGQETMQDLRSAFAKTRTEKLGDFRVFPSVAHPELLDVAHWLAVSGGAVSTGLGSRTSRSLSILLGFFNVRLGYWWRSGVRVVRRQGVTHLTRPQRVLAWLGRLFPVQMSLVDEWSARFPGVARPDWYLTDGGHFENLGAYELIRRRLPLIIVCDFEADAEYAYGGLGNLVRKARIDFNTKITFLSENPASSDGAPVKPPFELPKCIGTLEQLRRGHRSAESVTPAGAGAPRQKNDGANDGHSLVHGALARIEYPDIPGAAVRHGWLLYVKASLDGDEPADVQQYHTDHPLFPQESTADQFFDEAQWESYRCLGEHMAAQVFAERTLRDWMAAGAPI